MKSCDETRQMCRSLVSLLPSVSLGPFVTSQSVKLRPTNLLCLGIRNTRRHFLGEAAHPHLAVISSCLQDIERQKLNVFRMKLLGAEVRPVTCACPARSLPVLMP